MEYPSKGKDMNVSLILFVFIAMFYEIAPANAYLDPGSASIAIQAILAAIAGGLATIKFWGHKIKEIFQRKTFKEKEKRKNGK